MGSCFKDYSASVFNRIMEMNGFSGMEDLLERHPDIRHVIDLTVRKKLPALDKFAPVSKHVVNDMAKEVWRAQEERRNLGKEVLIMTSKYPGVTANRFLPYPRGRFNGKCQKKSIINKKNKS